MESVQETPVDLPVDTTTANEPSPNDEPYVETDASASSPHGMVLFQGDLESIQCATTTDGDLNLFYSINTFLVIYLGQMGENKTFHFELEQTSACLLYPSALPSDPKHEITTELSARTAQFITDLPYEKAKAQRILAKTIVADASRDIGNTGPSSVESSSATVNTDKPSDSSTDESSSKVPRRTLNKLLKQTDDSYINALTKSLSNLFTQSKYDTIKLRKLHDELIASGHISPLNEFYRSTNEAVRVTVEHCVTYAELIKWTLSLLQTTNKPNLIEFGHDLYAIAIDLDFLLTERIDHTRCAIEIQENLKHQLLTISENDLRGKSLNRISLASNQRIIFQEINSYLNASQLDKLLHMSKKLTVTSKDRMISDLNSLLLHLIQIGHTFDAKYRPMQTRIRVGASSLSLHLLSSSSSQEIAETFKSSAVANLARKLDEMEKSLSKALGVTLFGISQRLAESRFQLIK